MADSLLRDFRPHESWRESFAAAYRQALESPIATEQLKGWTAAAMILGEMYARALCLFVCYHGRSLVPADSTAFLGHIDLCLLDMGLARPTAPGSVPIKDFGESGKFLQDV